MMYGTIRKWAMKGRECLLYAVLLAWLAGCSATKYVPDRQYLLDKVTIKSDNKKLNRDELSLYLRQNPNSKLFGLFRTQLHVYSLSGRDSTQWVNKVLRRVGDAPVIYSAEETELTRLELEKAVRNLGYMRATVDTHTKTHKKKLELTYDIATGQPYTVSSVAYDIYDPKIWGLMQQDSAATLLHPGMLFDVNVLNKERQRITANLMQHGYYKFNKDYLVYVADTVENAYKVALTMRLNPYKSGGAEEDHRQYTVNTIRIVSDHDLTKPLDLRAKDSVNYYGVPIYYDKRLTLRPKVLRNHLFMEYGQPYNEQDVQRTYTSYARLPIIRYTNIRFHPSLRDTANIDALVMLIRNKPQSISFEVEGTNSAGDLGAAAAVSYQHRNLFKGSETFMVKLRGAYEAVSGLKGVSGSENFYELGAETSLNFPRFLFPFLSPMFLKQIPANTIFALKYNYQKRPEFSRIVMSGDWSYQWTTHQQHAHHRFDLLNLDYLYMPWIDPEFREKYLDQTENYILKYNYEDRFIFSMKYSYVFNSASRDVINNVTRENSYSLRVAFESAGNLLYAIGKMAKIKKNSDGEYELFGIPFAQYLKGDFDFAKNIMIDSRNSVAFHVGLGLAVPYGNGSVIPFEKRYFSGGANSVRGWSVRSLGPGSFEGDGNFLNQTGDINFNASIEYRTKLFWKLRGAVFVDAGNIWTLKNYESQPGGQFKFDTFYKQIAMAYGLGIRMDLDFFILRFDGGMKAINPAYSSGKERYPIVNPKLSRDFAFHFAVGYPF